MCDACEEENPEPGMARSEETLRRAREIEARMEGERVPEETWAVFEGKAGGAIQWKHYGRLHMSYEAADAELAAEAAAA